MFLELENLSIDLGEFKLSGVSLGVEEGDYVVVIGPTGSGKTVLIETINGFYTPERGRILMCGKDITSLPPEERGISVVYQDYVLFPHMSVYDNIAYGLRKRLKDEHRIEMKVKEVAEVLRIDHLFERIPTTLSGGEMQRVALARALVVRPRLLLMDEPFSALDVRTKEKLRKLVKSAIRTYNATVLHITHDFDDVFGLATKVAVMKDGKVLQVGEPEEVFSKPLGDFVADFVGTNVLRCKVEEVRDGMTILSCSGVRLYSLDSACLGEDVDVSIRPENIIVAREMVSSSAKNSFRGKVTEVVESGHLVWLSLSIGGVSLKVVITPNSRDLLGIEAEKELYVLFKAASVRILNG